MNSSNSLSSQYTCIPVRPLYRDFLFQSDHSKGPGHRVCAIWLRCSEGSHLRQVHIDWARASCWRAVQEYAAHLAYTVQVPRLFYFALDPEHARRDRRRPYAWTEDCRFPGRNGRWQSRPTCRNQHCRAFDTDSLLRFSRARGSGRRTQSRPCVFPAAFQN